MSSSSDADDVQETSQPFKRLKLVLSSSAVIIPVNIEQVNRNLQHLLDWHTRSRFFSSEPEPVAHVATSVLWRDNLAIIASVLTTYFSENIKLSREEKQSVKSRILLLYPVDNRRNCKWSDLKDQARKNINMLVEKTIYLVRTSVIYIYILYYIYIQLNFMLYECKCMYMVIYNLSICITCVYFCIITSSTIYHTSIYTYFALYSLCLQYYPIYVHLCLYRTVLYMSIMVINLVHLSLRVYMPLSRRCTRISLMY